MNNPSILNIETSQNVDLNVNFAGIGLRVFAILIDLVFLAVYTILITVYVLSNLQDWIPYDAPFFLVAFIIYSPVIFYFFICDFFFNGQSIGKYLLNIRVVQTNGAPIDFVQAFSRWILLLVEVFSTSGALAMISIILSKKQQRLGDMIAGTIVIHTKKKKINLNMLRDKLTKVKTIVEDAEVENVIFPEVRKLEEDHILLISKVLKEAQMNSKYKAVHAFSVKLKSSLEIESHLNNENFLKQIVKDYYTLKYKNQKD